MKLNNWFLMAVLTMGLTACNNDDAPENTLPEGKGKTVTVTIKGTAETRTALDDGFSTEKTATLSSAKIFFLTGNTDDATICDIRELENTSGANQLHNVSPNATHAIVVGNFAVSTTPATLKILKDLTGNLKGLTVENAPLVSTVEELTTDSFADENSHDGEQYKVLLEVAPIVARIEIGGDLTLKLKTDQTTFSYKTLTTKYVGLNNVKPSFTLGGVASGTALNVDDNAEVWPSATIKDGWSDALAPTDLIAATDHKLAMGTFGYNVAAGDQPFVMVSFEGVAADGITSIPPVPNAYLKIINFTSAATNQKITLEAGKIYQINNLEFEDGALTNLDNTVICVEATVTVKAWGVQTVSPEYGK